MLIGEAVLKSPAFSPRLMLLVQDLRAAGYTVWLEGLRLRFDLDAGAAPADVGELMKRYRDVIEWFPGPRAEFSETSPPRPRVLQHKKRLRGAKNSVKLSRPPNP